MGRKLLGEEVASARIFLHGSFLATGKGHGTDRALIAGLLGMEVDDPRIPFSYDIAKEKKLLFTMEGIELSDAHPNSVKMHLAGKTGRQVEFIGASIGGGQIRVHEIDGLQATFSGDYPTLVIHNADQPGHVTQVAALLADQNINIATMQLFRDSRGGSAVMVVECDEEVPAESVDWLSKRQGVFKVTYLGREE